MAKPTKKQLSEAARVLKTSGSKKQERIEAARVLAASGGGKKGGTNRAKNLTPEQRSEIARRGGQARQEQRRAERDLKLAKAKLEALKKSGKKSPQKSAGKTGAKASAKSSAKSRARKA